MSEYHRTCLIKIPVKFAQQMATQLPNAHLTLLDGSNHWMVTEVEDMNHIIDLIVDFVKQKG